MAARACGTGRGGPLVGRRPVVRIDRSLRIGAFTLVELLVVIAIIALLAGILLSALMAARAAVRSAECKSHLGQFAKAMVMSGGRGMNDLTRLYPQYLSDAGVFRCPAAADRPLEPAEEFRCDYITIGPIPREFVRGTMIVARDRSGNHNEFSNCMYFDGHVAGVFNGQLSAEFDHMLNDLKPWLENQPGYVRKRIEDFCTP